MILKVGYGLDANIMSYWFEEPYESFVELQDLYDKHIHDQGERRFIVEKGTEMVGLVELVEIDYIHRTVEFQIIIDPIHIYKKLGFRFEGELIDEFFVDGEYHNVIRMCMFQHQYFSRNS